MSSSPQLLLISGPAGAGKSATAEQWARTRRYRCARLSPDVIWDFIKSGHADAVNGWSEETRRQHEITLDGTASLVSIYLKNDISVVVDDVVFPAWPECGPEAWHQRLPTVEIQLVNLMPSWEVVLRRNSERSGRDNLPEPVLREIYDDMSGWLDQDDVPVIDNGDLSVEQTVGAIEDALLAFQ